MAWTIVIIALVIVGGAVAFTITPKIKSGELNLSDAALEAEPKSANDDFTKPESAFLSHKFLGLILLIAISVAAVYLVVEKKV